MVGVTTLGVTKTYRYIFFMSCLLAVWFVVDRACVHIKKSRREATKVE